MFCSKDLVANGRCASDTNCCCPAAEIRSLSALQDAGGWRQSQARPPVGRDKDEKPQGVVDMLPEWVGYSTLYLISSIPAIIFGSVIVILMTDLQEKAGARYHNWPLAASLTRQPSIRAPMWVPAKVAF